MTAIDGPQAVAVFLEDKMVDIKKSTAILNGAQMEYAIRGSKSPSILLINGAGGTIEGWSKIWEDLGNDQVVFAYNRLGMGKSSKPREPQTGNTMVRDLKELLVSLKIEPPYLVVGHSLGGFVAHLFALTYPDDVCGLVFLESSTIEDVLTGSKRKSASEPKSLSEMDHVMTTVKQIQAFEKFPQIPILVIAGSKPAFRWIMPKAIKEARMNHQKELLHLSKLGRITIARNSGHFPQLTQPHVVASEINRFLDEIAND